MNKCVVHSKLHSAQLVVCFNTFQFAVLQRLYQVFSPCILSLTDPFQVQSDLLTLRTCSSVSYSKPSIIPWRSYYASTQLQLLTLPWSPQSLSAVAFIFDFPHVCGSPHLDRRYFNHWRVIHKM